MLFCWVTSERFCPWVLFCLSILIVLLTGIKSEKGSSNFKIFHFCGRFVTYWNGLITTLVPHFLSLNICVGAPFGHFTIYFFSYVKGGIQSFLLVDSSLHSHCFPVQASCKFLIFAHHQPMINSIHKFLLVSPCFLI